MPHGLAHLLVAATALHPDAPAIIGPEGAAVSYAELGAHAGAFATELSRLDLPPGSRVAVYLSDIGDLVAALFGIHAAGAVAIVINDALRARQIEHVLGNAEAAVLVSTPEMLARAGRPLDTSAVLLDAADVPRSGPLHPRPVAPGDAAQIIYTSGSTGLPKGVTYATQALEAGVRIVSGYLGIRSDDRVAMLLSPSSVYGLNQILCTIAHGAALVPARSPFPADSVALLRRHHATVAAGVPPLWLQLLGVPDFQSPLPALRQLQNAGGHLPAGAVRELRRLQPHADCILQYGMTETFRGTWLPPAETDRRTGSMGIAVPEAELLVVREDGTPCGPDEPGELVHSGPTLAMGYWHDDEATAAVFRPHPLRPGARAVFSGDTVRRDAEGFFTFVGRRDRIIKTQGFRVGPDEIADVLFASGQITEAVAAGEDDASRGQRVVAWVVMAPGGTLHQLQQYCRAELPAYMQPRLEARDRLPRLPSGKYDVAALRGGASA